WSRTPGCSRVASRASTFLSPTTAPGRSFFSTPPASTQLYTLSLHDALPILIVSETRSSSLNNPSCTAASVAIPQKLFVPLNIGQDRKSTRLNSSHVSISYAVFCLKKKKEHKIAEHVQ